MALIVKSTIKINKGFDTWAAMVKSQDERLREMGIKFFRCSKYYLQGPHQVLAQRFHLPEITSVI